MNQDKRNDRHIRAYRSGALLQLTDRLIIFPYLRHLARCTTTWLRADGLQYVDTHEGYLFLTNHRDICMDSAWLSYLLRTNKGIRPYIGIGNNLFGKWWIEPFVRLNRCFVVIRDGSPKELIQHSEVLSQYICNRIAEHHSVWLAQREGRAKDGNDHTQPSLLKMLSLGHKEEPFIDAIRRLNICPVSISYEYDPCDYLKAREMQLKRDNPAWTKAPEDDLLSMSTGIRGQKGRVMFRFTQPLNRWLDSQEHNLRSLSRNEQIRAVADHIDLQIHAAYEPYARGNAFEQYLQSRLDLIDLPHKDEAFLMDKLREMYNNPIVNYEKSHLSGQF